MWLLVIGIALLRLVPKCLGAAPASESDDFPRALTDYAALQGGSLWEVLKERIRVEPFNLVATLIFFFAIVHTFLAPMFLRLSHRFEHQHLQRDALAGRAQQPPAAPGRSSFLAEVFHFLGEVEAIFGIWVVPLMVAITVFKGWPVARDYLGHGLTFTEPLFVVVIMTMAASRPILKCSECAMAIIASLGKGSPAAWWLSILTVGPVLGSLITEPAAMTISALLLAEKFYGRGPSAKFAYATLGLLFVNVSVGGTLTHFAAPPVLMVAGKWGWGLGHMFIEFGWKAMIGIVVANCVYFVWFRREFKNLAGAGTGITGDRAQEQSQDEPVPIWVTGVHILFLAWTVMNSHLPALFIGGFLFYLAFLQATDRHQSELALRPALLVGFFLAGLVVHGALQGWWIAPVLSGLNERSLFFGAVVLTAFNDNAAITYLASLVPGFSPALKYAVVAGAVVGGGLTVIANAPNPAGQSILRKFFPDGVSALGLFFGALIPTVIVAAAFQLLK
jgi:hypothetical protein